MTSRFICPHCRCPIDPERMDLACGGAEALADCRVCPECDTLIAWRAPAGLGAAAGSLDTLDTAEADKLPTPPVRQRDHHPS